MLQMSRLFDVRSRIAMPDSTWNFEFNDRITGVSSSPNMSAIELVVVAIGSPDLSNSSSVFMSLKNDVVLNDVVKEPCGVFGKICLINLNPEI